MNQSLRATRNMKRAPACHKGAESDLVLVIRSRPIGHDVGQAVQDVPEVHAQLQLRLLVLQNLDYRPLAAAQLVQVIVALLLHDGD